MSKLSANSRPSTFLSEVQDPNPFYGMVAALQGALDPKVIEQVYELADNNSGLPEDQLVELILGVVGGHLDNLLDVVEKTPETPQPHPFAPSPVALYSRVTNCEIVDIGSGNCSKLSKSQSVSVVATDKTPQDNSHFKVRELDAEGPDAEHLITQLNKKAVVTSYNSVTNLRDASGVFEKDGIHLHPDLDYWAANHGSTIVGDGEYVNGKWRDFKNQVTEYGDSISPGYSISNTFAQRKINIETTNVFFRGSPFSPQIADAKYVIHGTMPTPKYDGTSMLLKIDRSQATLRLRSGAGRECKVSYPRGHKIDALLHLEKVPDIGPAQYYVLLRVIQFRSYQPYHGYNGLRAFCDRIHLSIDGARLLHPGHALLEGLKSDGLIYRLNEVDYRLKDQLTFESDDIHAHIRYILDEHGMILEYVGEQDHVGRLCEFAIVGVSTGIFQATFVRERGDKSAPTAAHKLAQMLRCL